ncbi:hypothetical protein UA70_28960, partial [Raoultella planticola]
KQYILGLNGPWLIGMLTAATLGVWYLFGTVAPSSSDELNAAAGLKTFPGSLTATEQVTVPADVTASQR